MDSLDESVAVCLGVELHKDCLVNDLVYADDTLLLDVDEEALSTFMECVGAAGQEYGICFNFIKLEASLCEQGLQFPTQMAQQWCAKTVWFTWEACCLLTASWPRNSDAELDKPKQILMVFEKYGPTPAWQWVASSAYMMLALCLSLFMDYTQACSARRSVAGSTAFMHVVFAKFFAYQWRIIAACPTKRFLNRQGRSL